ncbi:MAG TPA: nuclear transport factor 2 family protein [Vicinamibacterales bacterium]|nr:nuclear transport factor 2 family protein [Vicinamibacterales bacterium]
MTTREIVEGYFDALQKKKSWDASLSDDVVFTSFTTPMRRISGRAAVVESTKGFYSMIRAVDVKDLIVEATRAVALTRYELQPPSGPPFACDVAEVFGIRDGAIVSFDIYFDSAPFPKASVRT